MLIQEGCAMAVAEAARNIVCSGGIPSAITNCLNFETLIIPKYIGSLLGL